MSTEGEGVDSTVTVAHEKLFEAWPALARWIEENKDDLRCCARLKSMSENGGGTIAV